MQEMEPTLFEEAETEEQGPAVPGAPQAKKGRPVWLNILWEIAQTLIMAAVLYFLIDTFIGRVRVENISMQPTLHAEQLLLVNKFAYKLGKVDHGDVIVFHYPLNPSEDYIKRAIGLPGDEVLVRDGKVFVNGQELNEPYISAPPGYSGTWVVPEGQYFALGDNRNSSHDSHSWGYVPYENLVGRALVVYWPLKDFKILSHPNIVKAAESP